MHWYSVGLLSGCANADKPADTAENSPAEETQSPAASTENFSDEMKIPYAVDLSPEDGADSVERSGDHENSPYFAHPDVYNMESTDTLTVLHNFKTMQQTSEWSCGVTAALAAETGGKRLVPVGHTVGVKLFSRGVVVVKLPEGSTPARTCGLKTGDVIEACGGRTVTSTEQFQSLLQENGTDTTELSVKRQGSPVTLSVEPERNEEGACCIGAWVRDSMAGIGTVTYYDPDSNTFGALGHGITDGDTAALMPFGNGAILPSTVKAVKKGSCGSAGELRGEFDLTEELGQLYANTGCGIFGTLNAACSLAEGEALPVGDASEGPAVIRSNISGDEVQDYAVEIRKTIPDAPDG